MQAFPVLCIHAHVLILGLGLLGLVLVLGSRPMWWTFTTSIIIHGDGRFSRHGLPLALVLTDSFIPHYQSTSIVSWYSPVMLIIFSLGGFLDLLVVYISGRQTLRFPVDHRGHLQEPRRGPGSLRVEWRRRNSLCLWADRFRQDIHRQPA